MTGATSRQGFNSRFTGTAGEHAVAAQLLVRGVCVFFPALDCGVDLMCANGCRVQVKTAHLTYCKAHSRTYPEGVYQFEFKRWRAIAMNSKQSRRAERPKLYEYCDVVALWGIEQNRFWIVPAKTFRDTQRVHVGPSDERKFAADMPEMLAMQEMGFSQKAIGDHFGINQSSVYERIQKAGTRRDCESIRHDVRRCENAWEHILNFGLPEPQVEPVPIEVRTEKERE